MTGIEVQPVNQYFSIATGSLSGSEIRDVCGYLFRHADFKNLTQWALHNNRKWKSHIFGFDREVARIPNNDLLKVDIIINDLTLCIRNSYPGWYAAFINCQWFWE